MKVIPSSHKFGTENKDDLVTIHYILNRLQSYFQDGIERWKVSMKAKKKGGTKTRKTF